MPSFIRAAKAKLTEKGISAGNVMEVGFGAYAGISGYQSVRDQGGGTGAAVARGVSDAFLFEVLGWKMYVGAMALQSGPGLAVSAYEGLTRKSREMNRMSGAPFLNSYFQDSEQAFTMRQAGMQMAKQSSMNTKKALLGNEAQYMHR